MKAFPAPEPVGTPRPEWLLFVLTLSGRQQAARMRAWRALKALGAAVLRDGVYLLPDREDLLRAIEELARHIGRSSGSTRILRVTPQDARQAGEFRALFDRTTEYQAVVAGIGKLRTASGRIKRPAGLAQLVRLRRKYESVLAQDFFPGEAASQTARALEELAAEVEQSSPTGEPHAVKRRIARLDPRKYRARTWATRARPWVDRLGSAWLIRRFIDPKARFTWLKDPKHCPKNALGFDFDGADFTHVGGKVTFEVLMESFALQSDAALRNVGALVHYVDVGGLPVAEAAGLEMLLQGARGMIADDDRLLAEAMRIFDLLYASFAQKANEEDS